jgi:transcription elongation factor Elf1
MLPKSATPRFECPHCGAGYKLVQVEADSETIDRQITCRKCGAPLQGRQGNVVFKYFLVDQPGAQAR